MKKTIRVVLAADCQPSDIVDVLTALSAYEDRYVFKVEIGDSDAQPIVNSVQLHEPEPELVEHEPAKVAYTPLIEDLIEAPLPGMEGLEHPAAGRARRVFREEG